jgi:hypothetical protein
MTDESSIPSEFQPFEPTEADCEAHAAYWREVAADRRSNAASKNVAHAQEAAWLTIALNVAGFMVEERAAYEEAHPVSTVYSRELA